MSADLTSREFETLCDLGLIELEALGPLQISPPVYDEASGGFVWRTTQQIFVAIRGAGRGPRYSVRIDG